MADRDVTINIRLNTIGNASQQIRELQRQFKALAQEMAQGMNVKVNAQVNQIVKQAQTQATAIENVQRKAVATTKEHERSVEAIEGKMRSHIKNRLVDTQTMMEKVATQRGQLFMEKLLGIPQVGRTAQKLEKEISDQILKVQNSIIRGRKGVGLSEGIGNVRTLYGQHVRMQENFERGVSGVGMGAARGSMGLQNVAMGAYMASFRSESMQEMANGLMAVYGAIMMFRGVGDMAKGIAGGVGSLMQSLRAWKPLLTSGSVVKEGLSVFDHQGPNPAAGMGTMAALDAVGRMRGRAAAARGQAMMAGWGPGSANLYRNVHPPQFQQQPQGWTPGWGGVGALSAASASKLGGVGAGGSMTTAGAMSSVAGLLAIPAAIAGLGTAAIDYGMNGGYENSHMLEALGKTSAGKWYGGLEASWGAPTVGLLSKTWLGKQFGLDDSSESSYRKSIAEWTGSGRENVQTNILAAKQRATQGRAMRAQDMSLLMPSLGANVELATSMAGIQWGRDSSGMAQTVTNARATAASRQQLFGMQAQANLPYASEAFKSQTREFGMNIDVTAREQEEKIKLAHEELVLQKQVEAVEKSRQQGMEQVNTIFKDQIGSAEHLKAISEAEAPFLERQRALQGQILETTAKRAQVDRQSIAEKLQFFRNEQSHLQAVIAQEKGRQTGFQEELGMMTGDRLLQTLAVGKKLQAGDKLNEEEMGIAQGFGGFDQAMRARARENFAGNQVMQQIMDLPFIKQWNEKRLNEAQGALPRIENMVGKLEQQLTINANVDTDKIAAMAQQAFMPVLRMLEERVNQALQQSRALLERERADAQRVGGV